MEGGTVLPMSAEVKRSETSIFEDKGQAWLKGCAGDCIELAREAEDPLEGLSFLEISSQALQAAGLKVEDLGLRITDIIIIANRGYGGSAPEACARHKIVSNILSSYPRAEK